MTYNPQSFQIVRHVNTPNEGVTPFGTKVHRQDRLYFPEIRRWVICARYDNHFLFNDPKAPWMPMCTCGAAGGIVGYNAYRDDASPSTKEESTQAGEMVVCLVHAQFGKHGDGSS